MRWLRGSTVREICQIGRTSLWKLVNSGDFPKPVKLAPRFLRWPRREVEQWMAEREAER